jgi:hypothetical protein
MIFGFIIAQFYSGSIVSFLLKSKHESIKTLHDLLNSNLNLALENVPYDIYIFNVSSINSKNKIQLARFFTLFVENKRSNTK